MFRNSRRTGPVAILAAFVAQATSAAAAAAPEHMAAAPCTPGVCVIKVFVDDCRQEGGIRLDKPLVEVDRAVNMRWEIKTKGFVFAANGIELQPHDSQFRVQHSPRPDEFRLHNAKARAGDFYYFVNVEGCRPHDPWIRNRP
ncbi:MAG: hypothetical protein J0L57_18730 [Burkholderiales bacterium]|nr:hypothetical protein [Burkholderiales bacterium]